MCEKYTFCGKQDRSACIFAGDIYKKLLALYKSKIREIQNDERVAFTFGSLYVKSKAFNKK